MAKRRNKLLRRNLTAAALRDIRIPNVLDEFFEKHRIDEVVFSHATGLRIYRLKTLRSGWMVPSLAEAIVIEEYTGGMIPVSAWRTHQRVRAAIDALASNVGKPYRERAPSKLFQELNTLELIETHVHNYIAAALEEGREFPCIHNKPDRDAHKEAVITAKSKAGKLSHGPRPTTPDRPSNQAQTTKSPECVSESAP